MRDENKTDKACLPIAAVVSLPSASVRAADDLDGLFRRYGGELRRLAHHGLSDWDGAADLTQDAFLRYAVASARGGAAAVIESPCAFLRQIVTNLVRTRQGRLLQQAGQVSLAQLDEAVADPAPCAERLLGARQQLAVLRQALLDLPPDCRAALLLSRLDGLSHPQIAARLGISTSMVTKHVMRAVRHCARRLTEA